MNNTIMLHMISKSAPSIALNAKLSLEFLKFKRKLNI